ncbi:MAG: RNA polymerase sigma factor [Polyangiales bacterium]
MLSSAAAAAPGLYVSRDDDAVPEYVLRAQRGDARAFQDLFRNHRRDVTRLCARLLGPRADLEDVVQEVFLQVYRSLPSFRAEARFTTWLHRVSVNVTLMHLRAARSRPKLGHELTHEPPAPEDDSPQHNAARNERLRALYKILDTLAEKKRTVFILHDLEGVPAAQISKMVEAPVLTVRTRLFYARKEVYAAMAADPTLASVARDALGSDDSAPAAVAHEEG